MSEEQVVQPEEPKKEIVKIVVGLDKALLIELKNSELDAEKEEKYKILAEEFIKKLKANIDKLV